MPSLRQRKVHVDFSGHINLLPIQQSRLVYPLANRSKEAAINSGWPLITVQILDRAVFSDPAPRAFTTPWMRACLASAG